MSARRTRIFIDFWNFQLSWNAVMNPAQCDWKALPPAVLTASASVLSSVGLADPLDLEETLLYASVDPVAEGNLRGWLTGTIERLPSWRVTIRDRRPQPRKLHCRNCGTTTSACPNPVCGRPFIGKPEKGVDTAIVTDMLSLAWQDAYDVAVLVSSDADFVPAVERIQERGLKVINAGWTGKGHELKAACWGSFDLNTIAGTITRPSTPTPAVAQQVPQGAPQPVPQPPRPAPPASPPQVPQAVPQPPSPAAPEAGRSQ